MINVKPFYIGLYNLPFHSLHDAMNGLLIEPLWIDGAQDSVPNEAYLEVYLRLCITLLMVKHIIRAYMYVL